LDSQTFRVDGPFIESAPRFHIAGLTIVDSRELHWI